MLEPWYAGTEVIRGREPRLPATRHGASTASPSPRMSLGENEEYEGDKGGMRFGVQVSTVGEEADQGSKGGESRQGVDSTASACTSAEHLHKLF